MNWIDAPDDVFYMATEETRWGPRRAGPGSWPPFQHSPACLPLPTGRSASCSHPRTPSVLPAGPISPSPCARARLCRCGHPRLRQSTTSPSSLRTRAACPCPCPSRPTQMAVSSPPDCCPPLLCFCSAHLPPSPAGLGCRGSVVSLTPRGRGVLFSFVFTVWLEQTRSRPALHAVGLLPGPGPKVLLCSVEGAILNFIFITFFVDELELCNLHLER